MSTGLTDHDVGPTDQINWNTQLLKSDTSVKVGVQVKRKRAGWDVGYLAHVLDINI